MSDERDKADRRQRDFDDLQHEMTGRDVGRISRFLPEGDPRSAEAKRRKSERERVGHQLAMLLQDPIYRARYDDTWNGLRWAEAATDRVLDDLTEQIALSQSALQQMEEDAAALPDGTLVFRDQAGVVRRADGSSVDDTLAATILWEGSEPSYEAYRIAQGRLSNLMTDQRAVERYQTDVLGRARGRMMDEDNPPSFEDLDAIRQSIERDMPDQVRIHMPDANAPTQAQPAFSAAMVPDLGSSP